MPFNIVAACEATPGTAGAAIDWPADDRYARLDGVTAIKLTPQMKYLLGVLYSTASTGARALLRQPGEIDKHFIKCQLNAGQDPSNGYTDLAKTPILFKEDAKLSAHSVNASDEATMIALLLGTGVLNPQPQTIDEIITGYGDTTLTALAWGDVEITWNADLKAGKYSIIGMRASSYLAANHYTGIARLNIPGNTVWKPGVPMSKATADHENNFKCTVEPWTFWGDMGIVFQAPEQMPNIQALSLSADTDQNVELALKKVS